MFGRVLCGAAHSVSAGIRPKARQDAQLFHVRLMHQKRDGAGREHAWEDASELTWSRTIHVPVTPPVTADDEQQAANDARRP
jgi:hypothetical protein